MSNGKTVSEFLDNYNLVSIDKISTDGQSVRNQQDDDHIAELVNSISKNGLLEPICVKKIPEGGFQLCAGFHRLQACIRLKWEHIPAHILDESSQPVKALALIENLMRRDMSLEEECNAVAHLTQVEKLSPSQICDSLGKGRAWVDRRLAIPHLPANVCAAVLDGLISIQSAEIIGAIEHEGSRATLLNQAIYGKLTTAQIQDLAAIFKANPFITEPIVQTSNTPQTMEAPKEAGNKCAACGEFHGFKDLEPVWICRHGCRPKQNTEPEKKGETA